YIPMVLSGKRKLSHDALTKLSPHLKLTEREAKFFQHLVKLGTSDAHDIRTQALDEMTKFAQFQKRSSAESETYE
ncbi:hypothetical protein ACSLVN_28060, partial [Klebsiella pneumoniae]|uniref:hypothetical protein n=1 Tax=Klebsiella pneumoniae TaxID=573 RepID=UPI003EE151CC